MPGWQVALSGGIHLPQIAWWLDAHGSAPRSVVSHAHFDHLGRHRLTLCTETTARLMRARLGKDAGEVVTPAWREPWTDGGAARFAFHPAGHVLGSALTRIEADWGSLLYTGDFRLRAGAAAEPCEPVAADTLVMETTYGRPEYVFPPPETTLAAIVAFCRDALAEGATPVLFGYSLGKGQQLLAGLTGAGLAVMLHPQMFKLTRIYAALGVAFPPFEAFDAAACAGRVVLAPPQAAGSKWLRSVPQPRTATCTGWAIVPGATFRMQCDAAFPLSDHADHAELLEMVERVRPRLVLTTHGFAREFAATLRARGIEAWPLGEDRQLELGLEAPAPGPVRRPAPTPPRPAPEGSLAQFARCADAIAVHPGRLDKIRLLAGLLATLEGGELATAAVFACGLPFPRSDGRALQTGWALLKRALLELSGETEAEYRARNHRFADAGDVAATLLAGRTAPCGHTLAAAAAFLDRLARAAGPDAKLAELRAFLPGCSAAEARYVAKILTGDLRVGLRDGLVEEAIAHAAGATPEAVREAHLLCGDIGRVARAAREGTLHAIHLVPLRPLQFMLASPEPDAASLLARLPAPVWLEDKYDGIRCQVHRAAGRVELFSRDLRRITEAFPEIVRAAAAVPCDFLGDGELLAWEGERPLPFARLQRRLGRKPGDDFFLGAGTPVALVLYDLLWQDGETLLHRPLRERRARLETLALAPPLRLAPVRTAATADEIDAAFVAARARAAEGLVAKDPSSAYTPGRRGLAWIKLKRAYATLDVVVTGVEYGHGKRKGVLSDYTFSVRDAESGALRTVGKAYTGLTDAEIAALTEHFLERTLEVRGRVRLVVPDTVLEVAFDTIQPSERHASGFALRFPRILRVRTDKTPAEIDTVDTCRALAAAAAGA